MPRILLEVCVDDAAGLTTAVAAGADRIELCSALALGGLTPSTGLMKIAAKVPVPVYALIRPRAGNFVYSANELEIMCADIDQVRNCGLAGIAIGASNRDGTLNFSQLRHLTMHANQLGLTLHRAFDLAVDYRAAIDLAIELGFERILTSGGAKQAINGLARLMDCVSHTAGRIKIMPAGGIDPESATTLLENLPIEEIHASCSSEVTAGDPKLVELGFSAAETKSTDRAKIEALRQVLERR